MHGKAVWWRMPELVWLDVGEGPSFPLYPWAEYGTFPSWSETARVTHTEYAQQGSDDVVTPRKDALSYDSPNCIPKGCEADG
jgi:hypothetical protein